ncbi:unnamed protein product [Ixodes pacificus]
MFELSKTRERTLSYRTSIAARRNACRERSSRLCTLLQDKEPNDQTAGSSDALLAGWLSRAEETAERREVQRTGLTLKEHLRGPPDG